jgi:hypothetical protein
VSLAGDDHRKASELPDDFPGVDRWAAAITRLYENRLISDYDHWNSSLSEFSLTPEEAFSLAREFLEKAREYLQARMGTMR